MGYQGRATHIHAEVTINGVSRKVTQIAFPETVNNTVHRSGVYASRGANPITNTADLDLSVLRFRDPAFKFVSRAGRCLSVGVK